MTSIPVRDASATAPKESNEDKIVIEFYSERESGYRSLKNLKDKVISPINNRDS